MVKYCDIAEIILKNHAPKTLLNKCQQLAFIYIHINVIAGIIEEMVEKKYLLIPDNKEKLCIFGVKNK